MSALASEADPLRRCSETALSAQTRRSIDDFPLFDIVEETKDSSLWKSI
jgi:hypothetical protein